jgi:hypothetical protein
MADIAAWMVEAAELCGRSAALVDNGSLPSDAAATNIVVAPHEFYLLTDGTDREIDRATRISVPVCTEQPGTTWFEQTSELCRQSPFVLDINPHGVEALVRAGHDAHHLRLGGVPSMDRRGSGRDRDVLFLGGHTRYRAERLASLAPILWEHRADLRLFTFSRPVGHGVDGLVFGTEKYDLLARSRILLNIHRDEHGGYFEWARMVEAMANGCAVLTEPSTGFEPLVAGEHFVESSDLRVGLTELLADPDRVASVGERAADAVLAEHPLSESLAPILDRADAATANVSPSRRWFVPRHNARMLRAQQIPVLPVFRPNLELRRRIHAAWADEVAAQRSIERRICRARHGLAEKIVETTSASYADARPEVSVAVTLFDYGHLICETLDSIAGSRDVDLEIVVVDDHSGDDGRAVVAAWMDNRSDVPALLLGSEINRGLPGSRNLAFSRARAGKVMVMDADNMVYPTALRRLADALDSDPTAAFAYSSLEDFGFTAGVHSAMGWHVPWLCEANYIDAQAMLRHSTWQRHGGYIDGEPLLAFGWEDWEFWLRLANAGEHGVHVAQLLGRYRTQEESMVATSNLFGDLMLDHLREVYPALPWPGPVGG